MFIGFSTEQRRLARMLDRMAGFEGGVRDALTRYTSALTGAYYFCPAVEALQALRAPDGTQNVAGRSQLSTAPR